MKAKTWRKQHKWIGLIISFFLVMFCVSGIILNHRPMVHNLNVSRSFLPPSYRFENWDKGFLRGTLPCRINGQDKVLLYGYEGCWLTDSTASSFSDFNRGLPEGRDLRALRAVVSMPDGSVWAVGQFKCYALRHDTGYTWKEVPVPLAEDERISDIYACGDTLFVVGRSFIYSAVEPYRQFQKIELKAADTYDGKVSLFRTVWQLHSGELFGVSGRLVLDLLGLTLIVISVTGCLYYFLPKSLRLRRYLFRWHDKVGKWTIAVTLLLVFTGWCLRPPVLIALVQGRVPAFPGTSLSSSNPWHDNLRMLRYDNRAKEWLLSASDGFYRLSSLQDIPRKLAKTPPVSVMGVNVWQRDRNGDWLIGSFSGMYRWNLQCGLVTDYISGKPASLKPGPPFGKMPVAGFTSDFNHRAYVVNYEKGSDFAPMPDAFASLPMSLWDAALEVHSGRIYVYDNMVSMVFIFFAGLLSAWALWTGYRIRVKSPKHRTHS